MYSTIYLGRQPIVDAQQKRVAYELLFRSGPENRALFQDDVNATASVIRHAFIDLGLSRVLEGCPGFVNVSEKLLFSPVLDLLPPDIIILEILESVNLTPSVYERCAQLKARGFQLALDDVCDISPAMAQLLPLVDYLKFDLQQIALADLPCLLQRLAGFRGQLLAEKVDTFEQFEACRQLGIGLFQGYFFARPTVMSHNRAHPHRALLLRLLGLVMSDADVTELEAVFKAAPDMVVGLLKLVNAAESYRQPVGSIREAIITLGTSKLKRWALIILFAADCRPSQGPSPLLEMAVVRGRMMELLAADYHIDPDEAFMTGVLSLADSLLATPMAELVAGLALSQQVQQALLSHEGTLGELLSQVKLGECQEQSSPLPQIDAERYNQLQLDALAWVRETWSDDFLG
ncbi:c-di-GMP-related signal transduction protein [Vogesella perlucida]|nr:c-di-GMP-related signal transduction protein [Vogesella perlucida]